MKKEILDKFYDNTDKKITEIADDIYKEVCVTLIEENSLKDHAIKLCLDLCDMMINTEKNKDPLVSLEFSFQQVKKELKK